ncbi:MAG TPA: SGNH/GDSL hydrolase family protein [Kiritimatiellia bacterium]|jgi:hypothetical protein
MRRLFIALVATILALLAAESVLRWRARSIASKEFLDPGLVRYDAELGWRLAPLARAHHATADYDVHYTIGSDGFRSGPEATDETLVLGDSFAFGFGVRDDETFAHRLKWRNLAVPGYSTDQELLLLEQVAARTKPRRVIVVVCLVNDLFDNTLPYPLQAPHAKPQFELDGDRLLLRNVPVPRVEKSALDEARDLASAVHGGKAPWWLQSRLLSAAWPDRNDYKGRFTANIELFKALVVRMKASCADLTLVLAPGRSLVARPASASGHYQDALRREIVRIGEETGTRVLDLQPRLAGGDYFLHDGHWNARGHAVAAESMAAL